MTMHTQTIECPNGQVVLIAALIMLKGALALEVVGMKRRGESAYAQTKRLFNLTGNKKDVHTKLITILETNGIIQPVVRTEFVKNNGKLIQKIK